MLLFFFLRLADDIVPRLYVIFYYKYGAKRTEKGTVSKFHLKMARKLNGNWFKIRV